MRFSVSLSWMTWGIRSKYSTAASFCVFVLFPLIVRQCSINVKPSHSIRRWLGCCLCHVKLSHSCCWFCKQILALVSSSNKDWWSVRNSKGKEGFVPANYVKETNPQVVQKPVKKMQKVTKTIKVNKKMSVVNCTCDMTTCFVLCLCVLCAVCMPPPKLSCYCAGVCSYLCLESMQLCSASWLLLGLWSCFSTPGQEEAYGEAEGTPAKVFALNQWFSSNQFPKTQW